jgi:hypothetical protein
MTESFFEGPWMDDFRIVYEEVQARAARMDS